MKRPQEFVDVEEVLIIGLGKESLNIIELLSPNYLTHSLSLNNFEVIMWNGKDAI